MALDNTSLPGAKWRNTHQATVNSVLSADPKSPKYRKVKSSGSGFMNKDSWYARSFAAALCEWARLNKEVQPTNGDVRSWLYNSQWKAENAAYDRGIVIAETPDDLSRSLAMALVGGAYHEAWHTEYSRRTPLQISDVWPRIQEIWGMIPWAPEKGYRGWSQLTESLLHWSNIIEDIRIERIGNREYPGAPEKMDALQDLILQMEGAGKTVSDHRKVESHDRLAVVMGAFRDLGLGYQTSLQRQVLEKYEVRSPDGWKLVTEGKLRPLLDRAIALDKKDDMDSLWIAMEILAVLAEMAAPAAAKKWAADQKKLAEAKAEEAKAKAEEAPPDAEQKEAPSKGPKSPPRTVEQADAVPDDVAVQEGQVSESVISMKPPIFKVGDRIKIRRGAYGGREAEVTHASLPDPQTGVQTLEYALVELD